MYGQHPYPPGSRPFHATAAGTTAGATATVAAVDGVTHFVTHISGHLDADQAIQLKSASTVLAEWLPDVSVEGFSINIQPGIWACAVGEAANATIANSTANCQINITGYSIP
jgi:hypothetical protein